MNMLDTYVSEVGRGLPAKNRKDIEAEIRSTLQDILDERSRVSGKPVDEELTIAVLKEYGSPEHVAASYLPERYLIGPRMFPLFWLVLRIVLAVIGAIALITLGFKLATAGLGLEAAIGLILNTIIDLAASAFSVLGNIVLVFFLLQHFLPDFKIDFKDDPEKWDPNSLKKIVPGDRVPVTDTIIEIVGACIAIVLFNFYPQIFRYTPSLNGLFGDGTVVLLPILSEAFFRYVPYLTALWGLTIVLDVVLLRQGFWKKGTRWATIALKLGSIAMAVVMLAGPSLVGMSEETLVTSLGDAASAGMLFTLINQAVRLGLVLAIIFGLVDVVKSIWRLLDLPALKMRRR